MLSSTDTNYLKKVKLGLLTKTTNNLIILGLLQKVKIPQGITDKWDGLDGPEVITDCELIAWTSCRSKFCQVFQKCFCSSISRSWEIQEDRQWWLRAYQQIFQRIRHECQPIWILLEDGKSCFRIYLLLRHSKKLRIKTVFAKWPIIDES